MPALDWRGSGRRRVSLRLLTVCVVPLIVAADDQCPVSDAEGGGACIRTKEVDKDDLTGFIQNRLNKIINVRDELGVNSEDVTYLSKGRRIISIAVAFLLAAIAVAVYVHSLMQPPKSEDGDSSSPSRSSRDDSELSGGTASRGRRLLRRVTLNVEELQRPRKKTWTFEVALGTMSSKAFVINMFADLCAPGLLPLAYGMTGTGFLPGGILLVVFYGMCVYTMWAIGRTCLLTQKLNFAEQWAQEIGPRSAWVPVTVVVLVCFGCCLSYACFYADIFSGVMPAIGLPLDRSHCLLLFTVFPTMPLCLMKDLSALAPSSFCALIAVMYTTIVMVTRTIDGSYAPGGAFYDSAKMPTEPLVVSDHMMQFGIPSLTLVNNLAMAFLAHYNGCKYYRELESHTPTYLVKVTSIAMGISCVIFALCGYCGYMTFGSYSEGVILNNYAQDDWPINIARLGIGLSIIAAFPLMMSGLREAVLELLKQIAPSHEAKYALVSVQDAVSFGLIVMITAAAWVLTDAGIVVGVVGALCGISIIYIIPCSLYATTLATMGAAQHRKEIAFAVFSALLGVVLAVFGLLTSLSILS